MINFLFRHTADTFLYLFINANLTFKLFDCSVSRSADTHPISSEFKNAVSAAMSSGVY